MSYTVAVEGLEGRSPVMVVEDAVVEDAVVEDAAMEDAAAAATAPIHTIHNMPTGANEH